jgi:hypothetical protein
MDNWHVTPRLSLQLGLRYDALPHAWERSNAVSNFDPGLYLSSQSPLFNSDGSLNPGGPGFRVMDGTPFYLNGIGLAGQNGFPRGLVVNDYNTLQPRVGFSEDLFGNGKTVLRGGFGTFFERMRNDIYNAATTRRSLTTQAPEAFISPILKELGNGDAADLPFFPAGSPTCRKPTRHRLLQFSPLQHEVSLSVIWVVQYVGNRRHQNINRQTNTYPVNTDMNIRCNAGDGKGKYPGDVCPNGNAPQNLANSHEYRNYQGFGNINQQENTTNGNYNGFQTGLRIQNRWGLSGEVDYTYSHEIDITTQDLAGVSNPWNLK